MKKSIAIIAILLFMANYGFSQVDTEFWFAPPELSSGHGDRPTYLRISSLGEPAVIEISRPAVDSNPIIRLSLPAFGSRSITVSNIISNWETTPADSVLQTGLFIKSTTPITVYYEIGSVWNTDIFILKGKNALGNEFIIPAQNKFDVASYFPQPYRSFDIVATRDNTVVNILPKVNVTGHSAGIEFSVRLNKGETYSVRNISSVGPITLAGSEVVSSKPVAITLKEGSMINGICHDVLGDQLVPIKVAGQEYVVMKGFLDNFESIFFTGIEDATEVFINGADSPTLTVNRGEVIDYSIIEEATHIYSNKPIYVIHITGFGCEMGMALLPSVNCKGSTRVPFTRSSPNFFGLNILVRQAGINNFLLNDGTLPIRGEDFLPVPGTNDEWYYAKIPVFDTGTILPFQSSVLLNTTNSFQLGIINGDRASACRYGYFSSFSTLFIGDDLTICKGETTLLDAGADKDSFLWSTGSENQTLEVSEPGEYWVRATKDECILSDTLVVNINPAILEIKSDFVFCQGDTVKVDGQDNFSWNWSDGSKNRFLEVDQPGKYWVEVKNLSGCLASDTIELITKNKPVVDLSSNIFKCREDTLRLDVFTEGASYLWSTGQSEGSILIRESGNYSVEVSIDGCIIKDAVFVEDNPFPDVQEIQGSPSVCPFIEDVNYGTTFLPDINYFWGVSGGNLEVLGEKNKILVDWGDVNSEAEITLFSTNSDNCSSDTTSYSVRINPLLDVSLPNGPDSLCANLASGIYYEVGNTNGSIYDWNIEGGEILSGNGEHRVLVNWFENTNNVLSVAETSITIDTVCTGFSPILEVNIIKDTTKVDLQTVSVEQGEIVSSFIVNNFESIKGNLSLYKKVNEDISWTLLSFLNESNMGIYRDRFVNVNASSYNYYIEGMNVCEEVISTEIHNSLVLKVEKDSVNDKIHLEWNKYEAWLDSGYEVSLYRRVDDAPEFELITKFSHIEQGYSADALVGFNHQFFIEAVSNDSKVSNSNLVSVKFTHPIYSIPNIITPNGDGYNDNFVIPKIKLYPSSELIIVDRWGKQIYKSRGYNNDWSAANQNTGSYYYSLYIPDKNLEFKGVISVLK